MIQFLKVPVKRVMELLTQGDYLGLEALTHANHLSARELQLAISEYGRQIVLPPDIGYDLADTVEVIAGGTRSWSVTMPLWTAEEGRSDLTAEMTIIVRDNDVTVEVDNIHVL